MIKENVVTRSPLHVVIQEELLRGADLSAWQAGEEVILHRFSSRHNWAAFLNELEDEILQKTPKTGYPRVAIFCSLQVCAHIRRHNPGLRSGILQNENRLDANCFSGICPDDWLLNDDAIWLPFGGLEARKGQLKTLFGERIFMRPNSSRKSFTGFCFHIDDLSFEISAQRQIHNIHDDEIVMLARARDIAPYEYRTWLCAGEILSVAPYSYAPEVAPPPCPAALLELAGKVASKIEIWADPVVADFALDENGTPKLVETNGFTSSGLYQGVDFAALVRGLRRIFF
jgi:hypothetical protein